MKATLRSVRIAPKKAQLVAKLIRGKSVPDAVSILEHTNKKGARLLEDLLRSAIANASHNEKQDAQMMIVKNLTVNKAQAFHRGVPMARGRVRPMRKFMSHIELTLGFEEEKKEETKKPAKKEAAKKETKTEKKTAPKASKEEKKPVEKKATTAKKPSTSTKGKSTTAKKKDTTSSTSKSSTSPKS